MFVCLCVCVLHLFDLIDEGVYEMFDLWGLGWEQDQFLIGQIELQHVLRGDGYKQDVCISEKNTVQKVIWFGKVKDIQYKLPTII